MRCHGGEGLDLDSLSASCTHAVMDRVKDNLVAHGPAMLTGVLLRWSPSAPSSSESLPESWQLAPAGATGNCARKAWSTRRYTSRPSSERVPLRQSGNSELMWSQKQLETRYPFSYAPGGVANQNLLKY